MGDDRPLEVCDVREIVASLFCASPVPRLGVEIELPTFPAGDPTQRPDLDVLSSVAGIDLPGGSALSIEPGGQLELSSPPCPDGASLREVLSADLARVESALAGAGLATDWTALDQARKPHRIRTDGRYRLMEAHFDRHGPAGRWMMNNTSAVQVNVSLPCDGARAWRLLCEIAPLLTAAFSRSAGPCAGGRSWASLRQACWLHLDPTRTRQVDLGVHPVDDYASLVLDAEVLLLLDRDGPRHTAPPGLRFGDWLAHGIDGRRVTERDLEYHLSTLFPPVRPRGWFEVRTIDAQPPEGLDAVLGVATALLDEGVVDELLARRLGTSRSGERATRFGLDCPRIAQATAVLFDVVTDALERTDPVAYEAVASHRMTMAADRTRAARVGRFAPHLEPAPGPATPASSRTPPAASAAASAAALALTS